MRGMVTLTPVAEPFGSGPELVCRDLRWNLDILHALSHRGNFDTRSLIPIVILFNHTIHYLLYTYTFL